MIKDIVGAITSKKDECDFGGDRINRMEFCIVLFDNKMKTEEYNNFKKKMKNIKDEGQAQFENIIFRIKYEHSCDLCGKRKNKIVYVNDSNGEHNICTTCMDDVIEEIGNLIKYKDKIIFSDKSGIEVIELERPTKVYSIVSEEEKEKKTICRVGLREHGSSSRASMFIKDIVKLLRAFDNISNYDFIRETDLNYYKCDACGHSSPSNNCVIIGSSPYVNKSTMICETCKYKLQEGLKKCISENQELVMSHSI